MADENLDGADKSVRLSPEENLAGNDYNVLAKKRDAEAVNENPTGICFLSNQVSNLFYQLD